jgi:DNA (cytosine-5)-methyltransferase 1
MEHYYLDLFSGIGGFALGAYWAGMRFHGHYFSEVDDYAIGIYRKRFPDAVPLGDVRNIRGKDLPKGNWIITGGFPCQDISVAGKGAGLDGDRSGLWFEYARLIGEIRPRFAIMENVGALVVRGLDRVLESLAEIGYDAIWQDIRASDVGASHKRERIWIIAYPHDWNSHGGNAAKKQEIRGEENAEPCGICGNVADSPSPQDNGKWRDYQRERNSVEWRPEASFKKDGQADTNGSGRQSEVMADTQCEQRKWSGDTWTRRNEFTNDSENVSYPNLQRCQELIDRITAWARHPDSPSCRNGIGKFWTIEPNVGRVANGIPSRVDRLKCLGNAVVPQIPQLIWEEVKKEFYCD